MSPNEPTGTFSTNWNMPKTTAVTAADMRNDTT